MEVKSEESLASEDAFARLLKEAEAYIDTEGRARQSRQESSPLPRLLFRYSPIILVICTISCLIGAVDIENNVDIFSVIIALGLLIIAGIVEFIIRKVHDLRKSYCMKKALEVVRNCSNVSSYNYPTGLEPLTEDMNTQLCLRDGNICHVPRLLLVKDDMLLLRPGQVAPCACETLDGNRLKRGERLDRKVVIDSKTEAAFPLDVTKARCLSTPLIWHLETSFDAPLYSSSLDVQLHEIIDRYSQKWIIPILFVVSAMLAGMRFYYGEGGESRFASRFVFSVPALIILPLLCPLLPLLLEATRLWNNNTVFSYLTIHGSTKFVYKDLVSFFGSMTGAAIVDKKGLLSPACPSLDKIVFFHHDENDVHSHLAMDILDLSTDLTSDGTWKLDFDDPNWKRFLPNLTAMGQNLVLNSCMQNEEYARFLDHLTCVSETVPRTIASANRRCVCQFPALIGMDARCLEQFSSHKCTNIGFYKRQAGDAPLPGLTKHRTPLEMAFCTVHTDDRSLHSHLSCQGTANLIIDACSHVWDGSSVVPLCTRTAKTVRDFYQRHSMTGYCLAVSYRPVGVAIGDDLIGKYIEVPLNNKRSHSAALPRSHSIDSVINEDFFRSKPLQTSDSVIQNYLSGQVLCGLIVVQYEAHPLAVQLVDQLENSCVRFVYFSRENELRSRVFAEKLGLEAGWNCHISLADEDHDSDDDRSIKDVLLATVAKERKQWARASGVVMKRKRLSKMSRSDVELHSLDCESLLRVSPPNRRASVSSCATKVGAIPNKARLPTGVRNVRPHLECVDNVPLLVGLFTDCTPKASTEMIDIMQENGEVVMAIGSSLNVANSEIFAQADVSICVEPYEDLECSLKVKNNVTTGGEGCLKKIASRMMAIGTDFQLTQQQLLILPNLISACRHRLSSLRSSLLFLMFSSCMVSLIMLMSTIFFLPLILLNTQIFLTTFVQLPILFFGTLLTRFDPKRVIIKITPKNIDHITSSGIASAFSTFCIQFVPTAIFLILYFLFLLIRNSNTTCSFADIVCNTVDLNDKNAEDLSTDTIRHIVGFHLVVYLCVLSSSWVFSLSSLWEQLPIMAPYWILSCVSCILSQLVFTLLSGVKISRLFTLDILLMMIIWSIFIILINELRKVFVIRKFLREQRRTKLGFDTKLGMNSPY